MNRVACAALAMITIAAAPVSGSYAPGPEVHSAMRNWGNCYSAQASLLERSGAPVDQVLKAVRTACEKEEAKLTVDFAADTINPDGSVRFSQRAFNVAMDTIVRKLEERARLQILTQRTKRP